MAYFLARDNAVQFKASATDHPTVIDQQCNGEILTMQLRQTDSRGGGVQFAPKRVICPFLTGQEFSEDSSNNTIRL